MTPRLYRALLRLYPAEFREEYGRELCLAFADRRREEGSPRGVLRIWRQAILGILHEAPKEHLHIIARDFRYACRILRRDAGVTASAVAVLALGIGATTLVFSLANGVLVRPLPFAAPERLVAVAEFSPTDPLESERISFLNYLDIRARSRLIEGIGVYGGGAATIRGDAAAEHIVVAYISESIFPVLGVAPLLGRTFTKEEDAPGGPNVVLLGEEYWARRYGRDPGIIGKTLETVSNRYRIVGVMPASVHFPDRAELWFPLRRDPLTTARTDYFLTARRRRERVFRHEELARPERSR